MSVEERNRALGRKDIGIGAKAFDLLEEGCPAAIGGKTVPFALGALVETAQPSEIAVASRLEDEGVDLFGGDAKTGIFHDAAQGPGQRLAQRLQPVGTRSPPVFWGATK